MSTQYEKEIEELLKKLGDIGPKESWFQKAQRVATARWNGFWRGVRDLPYTLPADQLMLTAIFLIVASYFLRFAFRPLALIVGAAGLFMFFAAFAMSFRYFFGAGNRDIRWRGQVVDMRYSQLSPFLRLKNWLIRRLRGL